MMIHSYWIYVKEFSVLFSETNFFMKHIPWTFYRIRSSIHSTKILIIVFILVLVLLFLSLKTRETFVTFFKPYDAPLEENDQRIRSYIYIDTKKDAFWKTQQPIQMGYIRTYLADQKKKLIQHIGSIFLTYTPYMNFTMIEYPDSPFIIRDIYLKKLQFGIVPANILYDYYIQRPQIFQSLELISTIFKQHFFMLSYMGSNITAYSDLFYKPIKVGLVQSDSKSLVSFNRVWKAAVAYYKLYSGRLQYKPEIVWIKRFEDVKSYFVNKSIDCFFYTDIYPNPFLIEFLKEHVSFKPNVIPIQFKENEKLFLNEIQFLRKSELPIYSIIDINIRHQTSNLLPSVYYTYHYPNYILCSKDLSNDLGYWFAKTIDDNISYYKEVTNPHLLVDENRSLYNYDHNELFYTFAMPIKLNEGAMKYAVEKGFITDNPSSTCQYVAGIMECSEKNIAPIEARFF
jgi:TRAP-type uncharacterized transport system substrate-binding protein